MDAARAEARELVAGFRDRRVLDGVSVVLREGVTALLGVNGSGKTTFLHSLCGLLPPLSGQVEVGGSDPYAARSRRAALGAVGLVPQGNAFPAHLRLHDFLTYLAWVRQVPREQRAAEVERVASVVDLTAELRSRLGHLSGGMQRRALIAQGLLGSPGLLLLDEPTVGLDPEQRAALRDRIRELGSGRCVVLASHIVEDAEYIADDLLVLHGGRIAFQGSVDGLSAASEETSEETPDAASGAGSELERAFLALIRHQS